MTYLNPFRARSTSRQKTQTEKYAGIAKILIGDEENHAGMGIVADVRHIITCAHVVNVALGRDPPDQARPTDEVRVGFPMLGRTEVLHATIERWIPPGNEPQCDIALLKVVGSIPEGAGIAILADITGMSMDGDPLSIFGLSKGQRLGNHVDAEFKGATSAAWVQLDGSDMKGAFIQGGFSGAAVWDQFHSAMVGMVVAKKLSDVQHVAYMIPTADLKAFWPDLQIEYRPLPSSFARTWTIFSAAYFFLLFAHWAADRGIQSFFAVSFSGPYKILAAFWGMHVYAFLAPVLLLMLMAFARAFRLHDWVSRIPSFGAFGRRPAPSTSWRAALLSLVAFVVLPLVVQIHFIRQFHEKGYVYIYPSSFGYDSSDPVFDGQHCSKESIHLCTKADAGRYSLAQPKQVGQASYWDNAYHYGQRAGSGGTVTFFPILQPSLILLLTALSGLLSAIDLFLVFRRGHQREAAEPIAKSDAADVH